MGRSIRIPRVVRSTATASRRARVLSPDDAVSVGISDVSAAVMFSVLITPVALRTAHGFHGLGDVPILLLALLLGLLAADLTSGVVHWLCDTFFDEDAPLIGRALIEPFREHHRDPLAMTRKGALRVNRANLYIVSVALAVTWWREDGVSADCHTLFAHAWWLCYAGGSAVTNQLHVWAHAPQVPRPVQWLQQTGLVISPPRHQRHHAHPFRHGYCITTGWMNPLMDALGIFSRLERMVRAMRVR